MKQGVVRLFIATCAFWAIPVSVSAQEFSLVDIKQAGDKPAPWVQSFKKTSDSECGARSPRQKSDLVPLLGEAKFIGLWKECGLAGFAFGAVDLWFRIDDLKVREGTQWLDYVTRAGPQLTCTRAEQAGRSSDVAMNTAVARGFCN